MNIRDWLQLLMQQIGQTGFAEWMAVSFGIMQVLLARVNNVWLYPTGIIGILCSLLVLFEVGLYAECLLNLYYLVMSIYGWAHWYRKRNEPVLPVTYSTRLEWKITFSISIGGSVLLYLFLKHFTPSNVPVLDAIVSATAWAGMWLLARRKIENWILLNVSNLIAIPLLFYKELALFALLTIFLFIVAVFGYFKWKKIYSNQNDLPGNRLNLFKHKMHEHPESSI